MATLSQLTLECNPAAEQILSALSDGVIAVDQHGKISFMNTVACSLTGWNRTEAMQQPLDKVFTLQGSTQVLEPVFLQRVLKRQVGIGPITKQQLLNKSGDSLLIDYSISPLDSTSAVLMFHDLSHLQDDNRTLLYQVSYDPLTRLPNRDAIQQTLKQLHSRYERQNGTYSILLLDLDRFKIVNDSFGHNAGDKLLKKLANEMTGSLRPYDNLGRWGGEEFLCILPNTDIQGALDSAERFRKLISENFIEINHQRVSTTASIGVANFPHDDTEVSEILRIADAMLYEAKRNGRNRVASSRDQEGNILSIARQLDEAIASNNIVPMYQPIRELQSNELVAQEALARLHLGNGTYLEAGKFIEAALHLQMTHKIDHAITKQTILYCSGRVLQGKAPLPHFVNVSAGLLRHPELVEDIFATALNQCQACGDRIGPEKPLVIEITEQQLLSDVKEARRILQPFLDFGLRLAVDDFGSGYSSLHYLAELPITFLKIDGRLVQRVTSEQKVRAIVKGIQNIADDLNLTTIAEYIEDQATLDVLRELGVNWGQGYFFGRPSLPDIEL
jgi:diguanylate cyclase (GGDEF)-like protein/PAS domain S-box-containing protein